MKYLILLLLASPVLADQRVENWQGICHFSYDANNNNNEVYSSNCQTAITLYEGIASATGKLIQTYNFTDRTLPKPMQQIPIIGFKFKGTDAQGYQNYELQNGNCVMVTSNYDAGTDSNNETVYATRDWNLTAKPEIVDTKTGEVIVTYKLACRGGIQQ